MMHNGSGTEAMAPPGAMHAPADADRAGRLPDLDLSNLPTLATDVPADQVPERLESAARRGRLAGFRPGADAKRCRIRLFGWVLDRELHVEASPAPAGAARRTRVALRAVMLKRNPALLLGTMIFTIWPGVWLMDSMLLTYIPSAQGWWPTWTWYLPITVLPMPWAVISVLKRSRAAAAEDAQKALATLVRELDAHIVD